MTSKIFLLLAMLCVLMVSSQAKNCKKVPPIPTPTFDARYFPPSFVFGSAVSAYQVEGEARSKGRGPSIWDTFAHEFRERIDDGSNGDVAMDFYNKYKDDVRRMNKHLGMNAYRFSISWSRVIPSGRLKEGVNEEGVTFYNNLIDDLIKHGLEPFVTIFHWDVPQALEDKYGGFRSPNIVPDFQDFAEFCFQRFGDRVKNWITLNEPYVFTVHGYESGDLAPGRCSPWVSKACTAGDSATEPYKVGHHLLLAHAAAVQVFRQQGYQGKIGITLDVTMSEPYSESVSDTEAAQRSLDFSYGWFMDPITYGQYPRIMQELVGDRLPILTDDQVNLVKNSYDFVGLNYYTSNYVSGNFTADPDPTHVRFATDSRVILTKYRDNVPIGVQASPLWLYVYPEGLLHLLNYTKKTYRNPEVYITENGVGDAKNLSYEDARKDIWRIEYFHDHILNVLKAICDGANVKGYFAWSFIDNFEWSNGFTIRMGLYQVDDKLTRKSKLSVYWFKEFLKNKPSGPKCDNVVPLEDEEEL